MLKIEIIIIFFWFKFHLPPIERLIIPLRVCRAHLKVSLLQIINFDKHEEGRIMIVWSCSLPQM
jgi:hypothetical protein